MTSEAKRLAEACAASMWERDGASQGLGMQLVSVEPGRAVVRMNVTDRMVNGHGSCHGGYIFTLADSAFAFACNSYDQRTVAQHCSITYVEAGKLGDVLTATAVEKVRRGRSGIYDVNVTRADGVPIAEFRGHSRTIEGTVRNKSGGN